MTKEERQILFNKFGGRCTYCGCELKKSWHVDHIEPMVRMTKRKAGYYKHKVTGEKVISPPGNWWRDYERINEKMVFDKFKHPERDYAENRTPSCHSCNITKATMSVEDFRDYIQQTVDSLNKNHYAAYKFAKRFGLIQETIKPVVFYFETINL